MGRLVLYVWQALDYLGVNDVVVATHQLFSLSVILSCYGFLAGFRTCLRCYRFPRSATGDAGEAGDTPRADRVPRRLHLT